MPSDSIVFVDTNVLLYADDGRRPDKHRRAREWLAALWMRRCGRVSTQVLNEYYANATGKLAAWITQGDARAEVRRYQHWKPWQIDHQTVETAWAVFKLRAVWIRAAARTRLCCRRSRDRRGHR